MKNSVVILLFIIIFTSVSCGKKQEDTANDKKLTPDTPLTKQDVKTSQSDPKTQNSDKVFFGRWDGKILIIEDNYKFSANENFTDTTGAGYDTYGNDLKNIIGKYQKYDDQTREYYFDDYKPEFEKYTSLKKGDKIFISSRSGVYPAEITGYYINMDDMIGAGAVFYASVKQPAGAKFEENEIVVCSFNSNMKTITGKGVTNQQMLDQFKGFVIPKLKGITVMEYDNKGNESTHKVTSLKNDDIRLFNGNFTGKSDNEFLVSVLLRNDFTNFTSLIFVMNSDGKILSELSPLAANNFTFSQVDGIVDINGDGTWEIITNDGYYEGGGYNLQKYNGGLYKVLTTGFVFGV
jgi:hypothetical protein